MTLGNFDASNPVMWNWASGVEKACFIGRILPMKEQSDYILLDNMSVFSQKGNILRGTVITLSELSLCLYIICLYVVSWLQRCFVKILIKKNQI